MEQPSNEATFAGVKIATAVYAFLGSAISLSYAKQMTRIQALVALVSGVITSVAVQPLVMDKLGLSSSVANSISFLLGLVSMRAIPALLTLVDRSKRAKVPLLPDEPPVPDDTHGGLK